MPNVAVILHVEACHLLLVRAFANHAGHSIQRCVPKSRRTDHDFKCLVCRPADREDFCFCCNSPATQDIILCGANSIMDVKILSTDCAKPKDVLSTDAAYVNFFRMISTACKCVVLTVLI